MSKSLEVGTAMNVEYTNSVGASVMIRINNLWDLKLSPKQAREVAMLLLVQADLAERQQSGEVVPMIVPKGGEDAGDAGERGGVARRDLPEG